MSVHVEEFAMNDAEPGKGKALERITLTPEQLRARRRRSIAIALAIGAFAVLFYIITISKLGLAVLQNRGM